MHSYHKHVLVTKKENKCSWRKKLQHKLLHIFYINFNDILQVIFCNLKIQLTLIIAIIFNNLKLINYLLSTYS